MTRTRRTCESRHTRFPVLVPGSDPETEQTSFIYMLMKTQMSNRDL